MTAPRTARERARAELTSEIKRLALLQLTAVGASGLSLRAVARELGMVSSAVYRYFGSRDELLTALIVDAYADLADAITGATADVDARAFRKRWLAACSGLRGWAVGEPHRFALIYGSPVPGYHAPLDTVAPAERVMVALAGVVDDAVSAGGVAGVPAPGQAPAAPGNHDSIEEPLARQLREVGRLLAPHTPPHLLARVVAGFAQLVGIVNLELAGHFVGGFEPADAIFDHAMTRLAEDLGLRDV